MLGPISDDQFHSMLEKKFQKNFTHELEHKKEQPVLSLIYAFYNFRP
jgi:hypothetical protein